MTMELFFILTTISTAIIALAITFKLKYDIKHDILYCKECPYQKSFACWDCKKKYSIRNNKYNTN